MTLVTQNQHALSELEVKLWPTADSTQWVDYRNWLSPLRLSPFSSATSWETYVV
jgi:hypothetical protein